MCQLACVYRVEPIESHGTHLAKMASIHNDSDLGRRDGLHRIPEKLRVGACAAPVRGRSSRIRSPLPDGRSGIVDDILHAYVR